MLQIKTKRVYDAYSKGDGIRILVDKLWPRGIKKENLNYDIWEKDIAPSVPLRQWFHEDKVKNWDGFKQRYTKELTESNSVKDFIKKIKNYKLITLIYATKDIEHNHIIILKSFLEKNI